MKKIGDDEARLQKSLKQLIVQENELRALHVNGMISIRDYYDEVDRIRSEIAEIDTALGDYRIKNLKKSDYQVIETFEEEKVQKFLRKVIVSHHTVTFIFINGAEIMRPYTNGPAGNQKGWLDRKADKEIAKQWQ